MTRKRREERGQSNSSQPLTVPLENFFGNDFLVLLYSSFCDVDGELQALRDALRSRR